MKYLISAARRPHLAAVVALAAVFSVLAAGQAADPRLPLRGGMIGLDTSHVVAFTQLLRDPKGGASVQIKDILARAAEKRR